MSPADLRANLFKSRLVLSCRIGRILCKLQAPAAAGSDLNEAQDACPVSSSSLLVSAVKPKRSEIRNLAATVSEQSSELQKVSAQLQIGDAAAQAIASNSP